MGTNELIKTQKELKKFIDFLLFKNLFIIAFIFTKSIQFVIQNCIEYAETKTELENNQQVQLLWKNFDYRHHKTHSAFVKGIQ
jgi:hypothetical protein